MLLMLVLLLRCMLDPWDISYYALPILIALIAWESISYVRPPVLARLATPGSHTARRARAQAAPAYCQGAGTTVFRNLTEAPVA